MTAWRGWARPGSSASGPRSSTAHFSAGRRLPTSADPQQNPRTRPRPRNQPTRDTTESAASSEKTAGPLSAFHRAPWAPPERCPHNASLLLARRGSLSGCRGRTQRARARCPSARAQTTPRARASALKAPPAELRRDPRARPALWGPVSHIPRRPTSAPLPADTTAHSAPSRGAGRSRACLIQRRTAAPSASGISELRSSPPGEINTLVVLTRVS